MIYQSWKANSVYSNWYGKGQFQNAINSLATSERLSHKEQDSDFT